MLDATRRQTSASPNFQMYRHTDLQSINKLETNGSAGLACNVLQFSCPYPYWSSSCPSPRLCHHFKSGGSRTVLGRAATTIRTWRAQSSSPPSSSSSSSSSSSAAAAWSRLLQLSWKSLTCATSHHHPHAISKFHRKAGAYSSPSPRFFDLFWAIFPSYESHAQHAEGPLPALELWPRQRQQGHQCQRQLQQTDAAWGAITNDKNHQLSMKMTRIPRDPFLSIYIHLSTAMIQYGI